MSALPWYVSFISGGTAACIAEVATLPIDTCKVRLQLLRRAAEGGAAVTTPPSMLGMFRKIAMEEGAAGLYKGLWPALHRQLVFASLRIGLYRYISEALRAPGEAVTLSGKVLSGLVSGAIGITVANPTDLVKVRMQSEGPLAAGVAPRYRGVLDAYTSIVRVEGLRGLWTGLGPAVARNSIINATELASYEQTKEMLQGHYGMRDGLPLHLASAVAAGAMATVVGNPVDVVKTRVMASRRAAEGGAAAAGAGGGAVVYRGAIDCFVSTLRAEGPRAFYQGVAPAFFRLTGWSIVMFLSLEQLQAAYRRRRAAPEA
jgi:solute carrier family 25 uncoupling protein 8/9